MDRMQIFLTLSILAALALAAWSTRWWVLHAPLHVFHDGEADWYVARSARDAARLQREHSGIAAADQLEFVQLPDDHELAIWVGDDGQPTDDETRRLALTCGSWAYRNGPGFLCSTEY